VKTKLDLKKLIIYEDNDVIVVNKPAGLLTIADEKKSFNLYSLLYEYVLKQKNRDSHLFVVHRLDKDTSGIIIFAKNIKSKTILQKQFEMGAVERKYEAIVKGTSIDIGTTVKIEIYLFQDKNHNIYISDSKKGKKCITYVTCEEIKNDYSYLDISIETGRRNQIRLSLESIGLPIVGDKKYSGIKADRMYLNAYKLNFFGSNFKKNTFEINRLFKNNDFKF